MSEFEKYVWMFYPPGEIYGRFFKDKLTKTQLKAACKARSFHPSFEGDTIDREAVRDILFIMLGIS